MSEQPPTSEGDHQPDEPAPTEVVPLPTESPESAAMPAAEASMAAQVPAPFVAAAAQTSPPAPAGARGGPVSATADRPEVSIAAAFAGGLLLALILKRVAG